MKGPGALGRSALYLGLTVLAAVFLVPFLWVFFGAFKTQAEIMAAPGVWLPQSFANIGNFIELFAHRQFGTYLANSLIVSCVTVLTNVLFSATAGYALTKLSFMGHRLVFASVLVSMMVPYVALFVPQFFIVVQLGVVNTLTAIGIGGVLIAIVRQAVPWRKQSLDQRVDDITRLTNEVREARAEAKAAMEATQKLESMVACMRPAISILTTEVRRLDPNAHANAALIQVQELMTMAAVGDFGMGEALRSLAKTKGVGE